MSAVPAKALNDIFFEKMSSTEGREKIAEISGVYIRDRLRETSFADRIVPTKPVNRTECQRSVNHDTLVKIVDIEPNSRAMSLTFRGQPTATLIRADRYEIPFWTISSEQFQKHEQELLAYEMPITKIIEENSVKDLLAIKDRTFLVHVESCVQAMQLEANGNAATAFRAADVTSGVVKSSSVIKGEGALTAGSADFTVYPILKPDLLKLKKILHRRYLRADRLLMTEPDYDDLSSWTIQDVGMTIAGETAVEGWKSNTVVGLKIIRTIKTDVLREGVVYCFVEPDFFGRNYILNQTKFYIDKIANLITWQSWMDIAMGFGNISGVVKLELFGGSVTPGATDTNYELYGIPKEETDIGPVNNRAGDGLTYPQVNQF